MNQTQRKIVIELLWDAAIAFDNHSSGDWSLPLTEENLEFAKGLAAWSGDDDPRSHKGQIYLHEPTVMRYCAHLVKTDT